MAAISQRIPSLVGGVSQQPDSIKLTGQLRECINYYPDPTFGLIKRPGIQGTQKLVNAISGGDYYFINKSDEDKLIIQVGKNGSIRIWDAQGGIQQTVNAPAGSATTYATHSIKEDLEVLQINDYILVLNRNITVLPDSTVLNAQEYFGFATLNTVGYNSTYKINLDGTDYSYTTTSTSATQLNASDIINGLVSAINGATWSATGVGNTVFIKRVNGANFSIKASGGLSGIGIQAFKNSVDNFSDLPRQFVKDKVVRVLADKGSTGDDYYVKFVTSDGGANGAGYWEETLGFNVPRGLNPSTMPHAIIKEADGTYSYRELSEAAATAFVTSTSVSGIPTAVSIFSTGYTRWNIGQTFAVYNGTGKNLRLRVTSVNPTTHAITGVAIIRAGQGYTASDLVMNNNGDYFTITSVATQTIAGDTWAKNYWQYRVSGDIETNPDPTFVNSKITGITFFRNRLVLLSRENLICSQAGNYFDFFASTVITIVESDPIDISAGSLKPIEFRYALQSADGLIVFGDNAQYILTANSTALGPATAELNYVSNYNQSIRVSPIDLGPTLAVAEENGTSTSIIEMVISADGSKPQVADITRAIPSYIPSNIVEMRSSNGATTLAIRSDQESNAIYIFRYFNNGSEGRVMSSWTKWTFPVDVLMFDFDHDNMFIVLNCDSTPYLGTVKLLTETPGGAIEFEDKYIDLRIDLYDYNPTKVYDSVNNVTKVCFRDGANISSAQPCLVNITSTDAGSVSYPPIQYNSLAPTGQKYYVTIQGNRLTTQFGLGYQFNSVATFPAFYVTKDNQKDTLNIPIVHRIAIDTYDSGPFTSRLNVIGRDEFVLELPQITSNIYSANSVPMIRNSQNTIPIMAAGKDINLNLEVSAPFPVSFNSMTWEGTYNNRGIATI